MRQSLSLLSRLLPLLLVLLCPSCLPADTTWTEVRSPHFRVLTDASPSDGKRVAQEFEQIRHVFVLRFHNEDVTSGAPLTVVAARDEQTMRTLEPFLWANHRDGSLFVGNFFRLWESQYAVVRMDQWNTGFGKEEVFHEYTHSVLHANAHWLPQWLDEGLAEFYSYTRFENKRILIGVPSVRMNVLRSHPLVPVADMMDRSKQKQLFRDPEATAMFYAESWAMVDYMIFGKGMDNGNKLQAFFRSVQEGASQQDAFRQAFGDMAVFEEGLRQYISLFSFNVGVLPAPPNLNTMPLAVRKLSPAETDLMLGEFAAAIHRDATAYDLLGRAITLDPNLAAAHQSLGFLEFRAGDDASARAEWGDALRLNPSLSRALFAQTMSIKPLAEQSTAELDTTQTSLEKVVTLAPDFAPAWVELARIAWKRGRMQVAYDDAKKAESLEPWRAGYHLLTARVLLHGGHADLAAQAAEFVAKRWGGPDHDEAVDLWDEIPVAARGTGPALHYDTTDGTVIARGYLDKETCAAPGKNDDMRISLRVPDLRDPLQLVSDHGIPIGFADTFWWGEDHFSPCHHLTGFPVMVIYRKADGGGPGTLLEMEVRDPWPGVFDTGDMAGPTPAAR